MFAAPGALPAPVTVANKTTLDENAAIGFDSAIEAAADLATLAVNAHVIKPSQLPALRELSRKARLAVAAVHSAYGSGNAETIAAAVANAQSAIDDIRAMAKGQS
ncbi:hypothetical protein [Sphingomonas sp. RT2P30]|uniref:hypothetical protein n=1 Tax=Parasphingomonas halimpatiens TaxID=3096162 RepID=UPI002FC6B8C1